MGGLEVSKNSTELSEPVKKLKVCIIDDDAAIRDSLKNFYQDEDYQVTVFPNARDALKELSVTSNKACDLLLCDLKMPEMDGLELMDHLNEQHWKSPVIFISGHTALETAVQALRKGAFDYIRKPVKL